MANNKKITELTPEQEALLPVYRDKWLKIGLSTERITYQECKEYAETLYTQILDRKKPHVILCNSPMEAWIKTCLWEYKLTVEKQTVEQLIEFFSTDPEIDVKKLDPQLQKDIKNVIYPHTSGTSWAGWSGYLDYLENVCKVELDPKWHIWKNQTNSSLMWCLMDVCVISQKPITINMVNELLHCDGGPSIEYADGFSVWSLNGVAVPKWLAKTPAEQINPVKIKDVDNAEVRREFVRKVGLERIYYELKGQTLDKHVVTLKTPFEDKWNCEYKLVKLDFGHDTHRHALVMPNASLPEMWHIEYVPTTCMNVEQAMNFRLGREEKEVDDNNGESWFLHGDVIIKPKGAKKTRRWPDQIA